MLRIAVSFIAFVARLPMPTAQFIHIFHNDGGFVCFGDPSEPVQSNILLKLCGSITNMQELLLSHQAIISSEPEEN